MSRATLVLLMLAIAGCTADSPRTFRLDASGSHDCGAGYIAFVRSGRIHRMRADGTDLVRLSEAFDAQEEAWPRWSPDGSRIAFLREDGLFLMDAHDGSEFMLLAGSSIPGRAVHLAWSPDGGHLAIALTGGPFPVALYDMASRTIAAVGRGEADAACVTWPPGGGRVLYLVQVGTGAELRAVWLDGTDEQLFPERPIEDPVHGVAWSPDGLHIAIVYAEHVGILDGNGVHRGVVPFTGYDYDAPFWSPDSGCLGISGHGVTIRDLSTGDEVAFDGSMADWTLALGESSDTAPTASFTVTPETPTIGELVTFDGAKSADDVGIVEYAWDFLGYGTFDIVETMPVTKIAFGQPGSYNVALRVRDSAGHEATTTRTVTVVDASTATLTIKFGADASGGVRVYVDGSEVAPCTATCDIETPVGATVKLVPDGKIDAWSGCDEDYGALGCELTMDTDREVLAFVKPPS